MDRSTAYNNLVAFAEQYLSGLYGAANTLTDLFYSAVDNGESVDNAYAISFGQALFLAQSIFNAFPGYPYDLEQYRYDSSAYVNTIPLTVVADFLFAGETQAYKSSVVKAASDNNLTSFDLAVGVSLLGSTGKPTPAQIIEASNSFGGDAALDVPEDSVTENIQKLYIAYFGRPAEEEGFNFWMNKISSNEMTYTDITVEFSKADEYASVYGAGGFTGFVTAVYRNVLGRDPESSESLKYWVSNLESGRETPATIVTAFLRTDDVMDRQTINNRVDMAKTYTDLSGPAYSAAEGYSIIQSVTSSQSSVNAALSMMLSKYSMQQMKAAMVLPWTQNDAQDDQATSAEMHGMDNQYTPIELIGMPSSETDGPAMF